MQHDTVLLNDFRRAWVDLGPAVLAATERVGASGWYILGEEVRDFEAALADFWGLPFAVGVGNGLDALEISLRCLGVGPGSRVLTTPISAFASTLAICRAGATPVFGEIDELGLLDLANARKLIEQERVDCLLPVHLYGHPIDLDHLDHIIESTGVRMVEDCAQSIGATWGDRATGTVGHAAATSFYPTKNLGALGDGGAVLFTDSKMADRARRLRSYGERERYEHLEMGLNSRLDELQAAILKTAMLPHLASWTATRRAIAQQYLDGIDNEHIAVARPPAAARSAWHLFPVLVEPDRRPAFRAHLQQLGIASGIHYPVAIPDQPALLSTPAVTAGNLDRARNWCASEVSLPIHPWLTEGEVARVIAACATWAG